MTAQSKMTAARTSLVLENPFFGTLALSLNMKADDTCQTAWIDGRTLGYNPTFIETLTHDQVTALVAHEIMHCALGHPWRRDGRNSQAWNVSCDKAINSDLQASGFTLPDGALYPSGEEQGKSAEWIFARINQQDKPDPNGQGQNKPDPLGELRDAPNGPDADGEPAPSEQEWKQKAASAMQQAKMAGKMPGGLQRSVQDALKTKVDLRSLLLRFFSERTNSDYTWSRPNARYISSGLYLPALESRELGEIAIGIDTSGSVNEISLQYARAIVESVFDELSPAAVSVFYFDTEVSHIDRFSRGESLTWKPRGGGGTDFSPVLSAIENEGTAVCAVIITDLQGPFPVSCDVPTIWLSTEEGTAPIGETVLIDR
jgi:predicted metal-dependent peptidase